MALMYCRECGERVSSEAHYCPHCGVPQPVTLPDGRPAVAVPPATPYPSLARGEEFNPGLAALLSLVVPGAGQLYRGEPAAAAGWFLAVIVGYLCLIVPGLVLHTACVIRAAKEYP